MILGSISLLCRFIDLFYVNETGSYPHCIALLDRRSMMCCFFLSGWIISSWRKTQLSPSGNQPRSSAWQAEILSTILTRTAAWLSFGTPTGRWRSSAVYGECSDSCRDIWRKESNVNLMVALAEKSPTQAFHGFRSVVVITFASHAKGPRFETGRKHSLCLCSLWVIESNCALSYYQ